MKMNSHPCADFGVFASSQVHVVHVFISGSGSSLGAAGVFLAFLWP